MVPPYTSSHGYLQAELVNLPRMEDSELICEYPFARVNFKDSELPVKVSMEAYTPFIPLNTDDSSIPCAIIRYTVKNVAGFYLCPQFRAGCGTDDGVCEDRRADHVAGTDGKCIKAFPGIWQ